MHKRLFQKVFIILLWIVLSLGIYRCNMIATVPKNQQRTQTDREPAQEEFLPMDNRIRVLIKTSGYEKVYHDNLVFSGTRGLYIEKDKKLYEVAEEEQYIVESGDIQEGSILIRPKSGGRIVIENVTRKDSALYRGCMECFAAEEGIVLVNELTVEEYLYGVVPSEMPTSYPPEALKAQAVSARTYAFYHKRSYAYPEWQAHVDDSTTYQVYWNISEQESTNAAVDATRGLVMTYQDELIESFYYSTSCGYSSGYEAWGGEEEREYLTVRNLIVPDMAADMNVHENMGEEVVMAQYLKTTNQCELENQEPWYRWTYKHSIRVEELTGRILALAERYPNLILIQSPYLNKEELSKETAIKGIEVTKRAQSGMAMEITIATEHFNVYVSTQNCIRMVLAVPGETVTQKDGAEYVLGELLPSAFFVIEGVYENNLLSQMILHGGGFGHGVGMSQNGAKCLANMGHGAEDILKYFYHGIAVEQIIF